MTKRVSKASLRAAHRAVFESRFFSRPVNLDTLEVVAVYSIGNAPEGALHGNDPQTSVVQLPVLNRFPIVARKGPRIRVQGIGEFFDPNVISAQAAAIAGHAWPILDELPLQGVLFCGHRATACRVFKRVRTATEVYYRLLAQRAESTSCWGDSEEKRRQTVEALHSLADRVWEDRSEA